MGKGVGLRGDGEGVEIEREMGKGVEIEREMGKGVEIEREMRERDGEGSGDGD